VSLLRPEKPLVSEAIDQESFTTTVRLLNINCWVFPLGGEENDITPWQQVHNMQYAVGSLHEPLICRSRHIVTCK
jgi:poly(3-hydroxyalkanoate) synthetase